MTRLIDASVAVKWVVQEEDSDRATAFLEEELTAPDFILAELANILWKKVRIGEIESFQASVGLAEVEARLGLLPVRGLEARALEMAITLRHPVYDCLYLALAEALEARVTTADKRFVRACSGTRYEDLLEPFA